jgi:hypothetical protein
MVGNKYQVLIFGIYTPYTCGVVPFGFDAVDNEGKKFLKENEVQTAAITEILKLREDGLSYKRIAKAVNENHKTKLSHMGVKRVLMRYPEKA